MAKTEKNDNTKCYREDKEPGWTHISSKNVKWCSLAVPYKTKHVTNT